MFVQVQFFRSLKEAFFFPPSKFSSLRLSKCLSLFIFWVKKNFFLLPIVKCNKFEKDSLKKNKKQKTLYFVWRRKWQSAPVFLPGESHGQGSLVGCPPWGCKEPDTTEATYHACMHACIGEGNGNPLQYSCLENPRDRGAWWGAVYGVVQIRTWLTRLSSSSSSSSILYWNIAINNVVIVSSAQQRNSAIHIHVSILPKLPSHSGCHMTLSIVPCASTASLVWSSGLMS